MATDERRVVWSLGIIGVAALAAILTLEVVTEEDGFSVAELALEVIELGLTVAAAVALSLLFARLQAQHEDRMALLRDLEAARADGAAMRQRVQAHLDGLGAAIDRQFHEWALTDAERQVGLLMLKGLSHKEIAALRGVTEATVRQQATVTYQKAGVSGRAAFCAYFLEDLLPPNATGPNDPQAG